eukprot:TRINITY_DN66705_c2_g4_i11.p1 TRINITY_DN66705_c2_g4~~TRINITY_DN66705_c2_g4_i11.p1  ORF type:complete len:202 (-),score=50.40 TRINITY_DN66705_c2_g4_i11:152-718(-)
MSEQKRQCGECAKEAVGMRRCGACGKIWYCDETCQRKHWKTHKKTCAGRKKKRAAQAAAAERHLRPDDAEDVPVTWEDQQRINKFGRLVLRKTELQDELKKDETELANLEDAQGEIEMLMDDDACRYYTTIATRNTITQSKVTNACRTARAWARCLCTCRTRTRRSLWRRSWPRRRRSWPRRRRKCRR